jgi:hypothetical protein
MPTMPAILLQLVFYGIADVSDRHIQDIQQRFIALIGIGVTDHTQIVQQASHLPTIIKCLPFWI